MTSLAALPLPQSLLLDYGGVLVSPRRHDNGTERFTAALTSLAQDRGVDLDVTQLTRNLRAGMAALSAWKDSSSRRLRPQELAPEEIVSDFLLSGMPNQVRAVLTSDATDVLEHMSRCHADHPLRTGIPELLDFCHDHDIRLGIVSNAHSSRRHRRELATFGIDEAFGVQIYSDEAGIRKPHPEMIGRAARALGTTADQCWFVGDTYDRDVVAGRRAGVGAVILTLDGVASGAPFETDERPDLTVESPAELLEHLRRRTEDDAATASPLAQVSGVSSTPTPTSPPTRVQHRGNRPPTLLIDHGGVISTTEKADRPLGELVDSVTDVLQRGGAPLTQEEIRTALVQGHDLYKSRKTTDSRSSSDPWAEVTPRQYWEEFIAPQMDERRAELLLAEAETLQPVLYRSKSRKTLREGAATLLSYCSAHDIRAVVVSNTLSGKGVRRVLADHGVAEHILGWVFSDELGRRKPCPQIFTRALQIAGDDGSGCLMLGDKVLNDAWGAQQAGIARRVLTHGGSDDSSALAQALRDGVATDLVDHPGQVIELLESLR